MPCWLPSRVWLGAGCLLLLCMRFLWMGPLKPLPTSKTHLFVIPSGTDPDGIFSWQRKEAAPLLIAKPESGLKIYLPKTPENPGDNGDAPDNSSPTPDHPFETSVAQRDPQFEELAQVCNEADEDDVILVSVRLPPRYHQETLEKLLQPLTADNLRAHRIVLADVAEADSVFPHRGTDEDGWSRKIQARLDAAEADSTSRLSVVLACEDHQFSHFSFRHGTTVFQRSWQELLSTRAFLTMESLVAELKSRCRKAAQDNRIGGQGQTVTLLRRKGASLPRFSIQGRLKEPLPPAERRPADDKSPDPWIAIFEERDRLLARGATDTPPEISALSWEPVKLRALMQLATLRHRDHWHSSLSAGPPVSADGKLWGIFGALLTNLKTLPPPDGSRPIGTATGPTATGPTAAGPTAAGPSAEGPSDSNDLPKAPTQGPKNPHDNDLILTDDLSDYYFKSWSDLNGLQGDNKTTADDWKYLIRDLPPGPWKLLVRDTIREIDLSLLHVVEWRRWVELQGNTRLVADLDSNHGKLACQIRELVKIIPQLMTEFETQHDLILRSVAKLPPGQVRSEREREEAALQRSLEQLREARRRLEVRVNQTVDTIRQALRDAPESLPAFHAADRFLSTQLPLAQHRRLLVNALHHRTDSDDPPVADPAPQQHSPPPAHTEAAGIFQTEWIENLEKEKLLTRVCEQNNSSECRLIWETGELTFREDSATVNKEPLAISRFLLISKPHSILARQSLERFNHALGRPRPPSQESGVGGKAKSEGDLMGSMRPVARLHRPNVELFLHAMEHEGSAAFGTTTRSERQIWLYSEGKTKIHLGQQGIFQGDITVSLDQTDESKLFSVKSSTSPRSPLEAPTELTTLAREISAKNAPRPVHALWVKTGSEKHAIPVLILHPRQLLSIEPEAPVVQDKEIECSFRIKALYRTDPSPRLLKARIAEPATGWIGPPEFPLEGTVTLRFEREALRRHPWISLDVAGWPRAFVFHYDPATNTILPESRPRVSFRGPAQGGQPPPHLFLPERKPADPPQGLLWVDFPSNAAYQDTRQDAPLDLLVRWHRSPYDESPRPVWINSPRKEEILLHKVENDGSLVFEARVRDWDLQDLQDLGFPLTETSTADFEYALPQGTSEPADKPHWQPVGQVVVDTQTPGILTLPFHRFGKTDTCYLLISRIPGKPNLLDFEAEVTDTDPTMADLSGSGIESVKLEIARDGGAGPTVLSMSPVGGDDPLLRNRWRVRADSDQCLGLTNWNSRFTGDDQFIGTTTIRATDRAGNSFSKNPPPARGVLVESGATGKLRIFVHPNSFDLTAEENWRHNFPTELRLSKNPATPDGSLGLISTDLRPGRYWLGINVEKLGIDTRFNSLITPPQEIEIRAGLSTEIKFWVNDLASPAR